MIDADQRFEETFVEGIRRRLLARKEKYQSINGRAMLVQLIEELTGMPYVEFARRTKITQEAHLPNTISPTVSASVSHDQWREK